MGSGTFMPSKIDMNLGSMYDMKNTTMMIPTPATKAG